MMYKAKKLIAFLLTLMMVINIMPAGSFANEEDRAGVILSDPQKPTLRGANEGNVQIAIEHHGTDFSKLANYYVLAWASESDCAYKSIIDMTDDQNYGFTISNPSNLYYVVLKKVENVENVAKQNSGTTVFLRASDNYPNPETQIVQEDGKEYAITCSRENGIYKFSIREIQHHTVTLNAETGIDISNLYILFRQNNTDTNSQNKAICIKKVNGTGTYSSDGYFKVPYGSDQPYDKGKETEVLLLKSENDLFDIYNREAYRFKDGQVDAGIATVYQNDSQFDSSGTLVTIAPPVSTNGETTITIGMPNYTARLDLYDAWNMKNNDSGDYTSSSITAINGESRYDGTVAADGTITFENGFALPSNLNGWTFAVSVPAGYTVASTTPEKQGSVYVFEAHKPDIYQVEVQYYDAWSEEVLTENLGLTGTAYMYATTSDGTVLTGTLLSDGSLDMDPVPEIATWQIGLDDKYGEYTFTPSSAFGQENPYVDNGSHTYVLNLRKARTHRMEIEYYDSWGQGRIDGGVSVGDGYTLEALGTDGTIYTGTINGMTGEVTFTSEIPTISSWTVKHYGIAEDPQMIGEFKTDFGPENPSEESRYDEQANGAVGYYVLTASKPNTYSAELTFYSAEGDTRLEGIMLSETYKVKAKAAAPSGTEYTGTIGTDGKIVWNDNVTELPQISEFKFYKANGTEEVTRIGEYNLSVASYDDADLYATQGAYQIQARARKMYPAALEYLPRNEAPLNAKYYLVASVDGVKVAYAAVPESDSRLTFIPFGEATGVLHLRLNLAADGDTPAAQSIRLPEETEFTLVKSESGEMTAAEIYQASPAATKIDDYALTLTPSIEPTHEGVGTADEDTLVLKAQKMWVGNTIKVSTYDFNENSLIEPDKKFGNEYYLRVRIRNQETNEVVGWSLIPLTQWEGGPESGSQADTVSLTVEKFAQSFGNDNNGKPLDPNNASLLTTFDSAIHYIEVDTDEYPARVVKIKGDKNQITWEKATRTTGHEAVDDNPPDGYKYIKGRQESDCYRIRLMKAKPVNYYVRLKFNTTDTTKINLDGGLYVKVTLGHQTGEDSYGWEPVDNATYKKSPYMTMDTTNGCTYINIPITEWKNREGHKKTDEKFRGTEHNIKVELAGVGTNSYTTPTPAGTTPMKVGSYVNNAEVIAYPTFTESVDRIKIDYDDSASVPEVKKNKQDIYDVVTLAIEPESFSGYSLDYILNGYNIVTLCPNTTASPSNSGESAFGDGDFLMKNHCMGGVLIRGDIIHITGTGVADSEFITKPSVIGGYVPASGGPFINNRVNNNHDWNGYIGSVNTVVGDTVNGMTAAGPGANPRPDGSLRGYTGSAGHTAAYGDTYVDWNELQSKVLEASDKLATGARTIDPPPVQDEWGNTLTSGTINVTLGDNVTVNYPPNFILTVNIIAPEGLDLQNSKNIPSTVINNTGTGTYIAPKVTVNGQSLTTVEDGSGMSLVWNYPYATKVNLTTDITPFFGHIVAPRSFIDVEGGNYSGCMVGNKVSSAGEGHLYPYNGGKLVLTDVGYEATKAIDDEPATEDKLFYFELDELDQDGSLNNMPGEWVQKEIVRNKSENIAFEEIKYTNAGTYYYKISEYQHSVSTGISLDTTEYIVKTVVTPSVSGTTTTLVTTQTYYRIPEGVSSCVESYADGETIKYRINESVLQNLNVPAGMSGAQIAAQYLTFNNTTNNNSNITVRKTLSGAELEADKFSFTIEQKFAPDASVGSVDESQLKSPAKNNASGVVNFGKLDFMLQDGQDSGTWVYTVKEVQPVTPEEGYTFDQSEYELTFTVTRGSGTLNVAKSYKRIKNAVGETVNESISSITFENKYEEKKGDLEISKTVVSPIPAERTQTFYFTVALKNKSGQPLNGTYSGYAFDKDGKAAIPVAGGSTVTISGIPAGSTYTIEEVADSNFTANRTSTSGSIPETIASEAFENTRKTGGISISKAVVSPIPAEATKAFTFTIELSNQTITGNFTGTFVPGNGEGTEAQTSTSEIAFTNGVATVTVKGGQKLTIDGLPAGITYTVTEAADDDFTADESAKSGTVSDSAADRAFTNTRKTGDLEVSKSVTGTSDKTKVFNFTVTLLNGTDPVSGEYEVDVTAAGDQLSQFTEKEGKRWIAFGNDGKAQFTLKADEKVIVKGLPQGVSYTVEETGNIPGGYANTSGTATGTISGTRSVAQFVNNYTLETISIGFGGKKTITGTDSTNQVFTFELYETDSSYSIQGKTPIDTKSTSGTISAGTTGQGYTFDKTITYSEKNKDYYYVIVEKAFADGEHDEWTTSKVVYKRHVHISDGGNGKLVKTITKPNTDDDPTEVEAVSSDLDFVNAYNASGKVTFNAKKIFTSGTLGQPEFTFRLTQVKSETDLTQANTNVVLASAVEKTVDATSGAVITFDKDNADNDISFVKKTGQDDTANTYWFLLEEVVPNTVQNGIDPTTHVQYSTAAQKLIQVTLTDDGEGHLTAVKAPGTQTNGSDTDLDAVFTNEQLGGVKVTKSFVLNDGATVPNGFAIYASYTINNQPVVKTLKINGGDIIPTADGNNKYTWTINDLPINTEVTFTEDGITLNNYSVKTTFKGLAVADQNAPAGTLTAAKDTNEGTFVNTYTRDKGSLKIKKTVSVNGSTSITDASLVNGDYFFRVKSKEGVEPSTNKFIKIQIANGVVSGAWIVENESITEITVNESKEAVLDELPTGLYAVTEELTTEQIENGISLLVKPDTDIRIVKDGDGVTIPTAVFQNNREVGELEISKEVTGTTDNTKDFKFNVTLTFPEGIKINDKYPVTSADNVKQNALNKNSGVFDTDGQIKLTNPETSELSRIRTIVLYLKAEESVLIKNLPAGTTYTVSEDTSASVIPAGYANTNPAGGTYSGSIGRTRSVAEFVNDYTLKTTSVAFGGLKTIEGTDSTTKAFTFELYDANDNTYDITNKKPIQTVSTSGKISESAGQSYGFRAITYSELLNSQLGDDHYYVIKEQAVSYTGWTISDVVYKAHVHVYDGGDGQLYNNVEIFDSNGNKIEGKLPGELNFKNTYEATGNVSFKAKKIFTNGNLNSHPFKIQLTQVTGKNSIDPVLKSDSTPAYQQTVTLDTNANTQNAVFADVKSFVKNKDRDDTKNSYWFLIEEIDGNPDPNNIKYDTKVKRWIEVTLTDDDAGHLTAVKTPAAVTENGTDLDAVFTNEQLGEISVQKLVKDNNGGDLTTSNTYTFTITQQNVPAGTTPTTTTLTVGGNGAAQKAYGLPFGTYRVEETTTPGIEGYKLTGTTLKVGNEEITTVTIGPSSQTISVLATNTYTRKSGVAEIKVTKDYNNWGDNKTFTFTLTAGTSTDSKGTEIDTPMPADATGSPKTKSVEVTSATSGKIATFGEITYTTAGTYNYTIKEVVPADKKGVTYDENTYAVQVVVEEKENGLESTVTYGTKAAPRTASAENLTIRNTYEATGSVSFKAKKVFTNGNLKDHPFTIKLTQVDVDGQGNTSPKTGGVVKTETADADSSEDTVEFNAVLSFVKNREKNETGVYYFLLEEVVPANLGSDKTDELIKYDINNTNRKLITVTVADDGKGHLTVSKDPDAISDLDVTFTNEQLGRIELYKVVKNSEKQPISTNNEYTFTITGTGVNETVDVIANNSTPVVIDNLPLNVDLKVTETTPPAIAGYNYTGTTLQVDDGEAASGTEKTVKLTTSTTDHTITVHAVNTYERKNGTATIQVTKDYNNWGDGKVFTFTLTAGSNTAGKNPTPMPEDAEDGVLVKTITSTGATTDASRIANFGSIAYDTAGTYNYMIQESVAGDAAGLTSDTRTYNVQVVVEEDGDSLKSTVTYGTKAHPETPSENSLTIYNTYDAAGSGSFSGTKTLNGREFKDGETFSFTITPQDGAPLRRTAGGDSEESVTVETTAIAAEAEDKNHAAIPYGEFHFIFGDLDEVEPDDNGVRTKDFKYTVSEVRDTGNGIVYEDAKELTITVTDDGTGILNVALKGSTTAPDFTNTYHASGSTDLKVKKTFKNGKLSENPFKFTLTQVDEQGQKVTDPSDLKLAQNPTTVSTTQDNNADNEVVTLVNNIAFTEADVGKTFYFIIEEDTTGVVLENNIAGGVRYDTNRSKPISITVTDPQDGSPLVITKNPARTTGADFDVSFTNEQLGKIQLSKIVNNTDGQPITTNNKYTFTITGTGVSETVEVEANSNTPAEIINLPLGEYTVTETTPPGIDGYNYKATKLAVDGGMPVTDTSTSVTITNNQTKTVSVVATNTYERKSGKTEIQVTKDYNNWGDAKAFTFTLTAKNNTAAGGIDTPMPEDASGAPKVKSVTIESATAGNDHVAKFGEIEFNTIGEYNYTIKETVSGDVGGLVSDDTEYSVKVVVTYDEAGTGLESTVWYAKKATNTVADQPGLVIKNTYDAKGFKAFSGIKTLEGRAFEAGEIFKFTITPKNSAPLRITEGGESQTSVEITTTAIDGDNYHATIPYGPLYFTYADVKNETPDKDGVRTKTFEYTISEVPDANKKGITYEDPKTLSVTVKDNGSGTLSVALTQDTLAPSFTNTYEVKGTLSFRAKKTFANGMLSEHPFKIRLTQVTGENCTEKATEHVILKRNPVTTVVAANGNSQIVTFGTSEVKELIRNKTQDDRGTYWFLIEELDEHESDDIRYDTTRQRRICVTVSDDGSGKLTVAKDPQPDKVNNVDLDAQFVNEQLGKVKVTKSFVLNGAAIPENFKITASYSTTDTSGTTETTKILKISGGDIAPTVDPTDNNKYTWEIAQLPIGTKVTFVEDGATVDGYSLKTTTNGFANDETGNVLAAAKTAPEGVFINTYTRQTGSLKIKKIVKVSGSEQTAKDTGLVDGTYRFTVTGTGLAADAGSRTVTITIEGGEVTQVSDNATLKDGFAVISGLPTGTYEISEIIDSANTAKGIILNDSSNNKREITVEPNNTDNIPAAEFTNSKDIGGLTVKKTISGTSDRSKSFEFTVTLTPPTGVTLEDSYPVTAANSVKESNSDVITAGKITLQNITGDNTGKKTVTFNLKGDETLTIDQLPVNTGYSVAENGMPSDGYEKVTSGTPTGIIAKGTNTVEIKNQYKLGTTSVTFGGNKFIVGTKSTDTVFTFELFKTAEYEKGATVPADDSVYDISGKTAIEAYTNGTIGTGGTKYSFRDLTYTATDDGKTFFYVIREKALSKDETGWTTSEVIYRKKVVVEDDHLGKLKATVTGWKIDGETVTEDNGINNLNFTNTYEASGTVSFDAKKIFKDGNLSNQNFTIRLKQVANGTATDAISSDKQWERTVDTGSKQTVKFDKVVEFFKGQTTNGYQDDTTNADNGTPKEYWFLLEEEIPTTGLTDGIDSNGIQYETVARRWIKVTLTDNGDGTLTPSKVKMTTADHTDSDEGIDFDAVFVNTQLGSIQVQKSFSSDDEKITALPKNFQITAEYTVPGGTKQTAILKTTNAGGATAPTSGNGTTTTPYIWEFKNLPIGTTFTFTESGATIEGYTLETKYNGDVVSDGKGTLTVVDQRDPIPTGAFVNTYKRDYGKLKIRKTVTVNGEPTDTTLVDGEYTFTITGVAGTLTANEDSRTVIIKIEGGKVKTAKLGENDLTVDPNGYAIIENLPTGRYTVTELIPVTDNDQRFITPAGDTEITLEVVKNEDGAVIPTADFCNNREIGDLKVFKTVQRTSNRTKDFVFTVTLSKDGAAITGSYPVETNARVKGANSNVISDGKIAFNTQGQVKFTLRGDESILIKDLPGGTTYTVTEVKNDSDHPYPAGYEQTKPAGGGDATGTIGRTPKEEEFINTYNMQVLDIPFGGSKSIEGTDSTNKEFAFELYETGDDYDHKAATAQLKATAKTSGTIRKGTPVSYSLGSLQYDEKGTHYYVILEKATDSNSGWTYDTTIYKRKVVLEMVEGNNTKMAATITDENSNPVADVSHLNFTNAYEAKGKVSLKAAKSLMNGNLSGGQFTFDLYETESNFYVPGTLLESKTNRALDPNTKATAAPVEFGEIEYVLDKEHTQSAVLKTYYYVIRENTTNADGQIVYDGTEYRITVTVSDPEQNGQLQVDRKIRKFINGAYVNERAADNMTFRNEQLGKLNITKSFAGNVTLTEAQKKQISFKVEGVKGTDTEGYSKTYYYGTATGDDKATWNGNTLTITGLKIGEYIVTENGDVMRDSRNEELYIHTRQYKVGASETQRISATEEGNTMTITNRYDIAELEITKTVQGIRASDDAEMKIRFTVKGDGLPSDGIECEPLKYPDDFTAGKATIRLTHKDGLLPGKTYTVTENAESANVAGYSRTTVVGSMKTTEDSEQDSQGTATISASTGKGSIAFANSYARIIQIRKIDLTDSSELAGAKIQLLDGQTVVDEWTSTDTQEDHTVTGLEIGRTYTLHEVMAPDGYTITADTTFSIGTDGEITYSGTKTSEDILLIGDNVTRVKVQKTDVVTGEELTGAHIQILDKDGEIVEEWDSEKGKPHEVTKLKTGETYTLRETVTPDGYNIAADTHFTIRTDGTVESSDTTIRSADGVLLVEDAMIRVKVQKTDVTTGEELTGAHIQILDKDGEIVDEWDSEKGKPHEVTKLKAGETYALRETVAPDGYTVTADTTFTIEKDGKITSEDTTIRESDGALLVEDVMTRVKVQKTDVTTGEELTGAHIQILDKNGTVVDEWDSEKGKPHEVTKLKTGETYTLRETVAPDGYMVTADTTFTIDENGKVTSEDTTIRTDGVLLVEDERIPLTSAAVRKVWDDGGNRDGLRPAALKIDLLADGEATGLSVTLNAANNWIGTLKDLPVSKDEKKITYTWKESEVIGYTLKSSKAETGTLTTLTNTHAPEKTEVSVKKVWEDGNDGLKKRPDAIEVQLYADGKALGDAVTLNDDNGWAYTWKDLYLNAFENGASDRIRYTVAETEIPEGYVYTVTGTAATGFVITNTYHAGRLIIEKSFAIDKPELKQEEEEESTDFEVQKIWLDDNDDADGNRPESITVRLYAGGIEIKEVQLKANNGWKYHFGNLPKFKDGKPIHYSVSEDPVDGYSTEIDGFRIYNRYQPERTHVTVRKIWNDDDNKQKIRPESILMKLNNGMTVILSEENGWMASITDLPSKVNGKPAEYTWTEQTVMGYELESKEQEDTVTTFTNKPWTRPEQPSQGRKPKTAGETLYVFDEYDTPLGVEIVINHVGDCFD